MSSTFPEIMTKHLHLRQLKPEDIQGVYRLFSDTTTMMFDGGQTMGNIDEAYRFIQAYASINQPAIRWAITEKKTGAFFGTAGFHQIDYQVRKAEIGGELLKNTWGKGIAKEGFQALLSFGFQKMRLNRIEAMISPENKAAIATVQGAPFKKEGLLRQYQKWGNRLVDLEVYSILYNEWKSLNSRH